ncbi:response regulator transcription factor [Paenibacillus sp. SYP-B3998]|uniref:Response regulator transcription factor n=1 Tax=Paenibacillus sp. SYP-B3998 TaxID=2678564 RepID=A0A6G4A1B5_9BACL|nr:response regulator transcription factor [Paenibacillus sp. SYP-B3998]NEW08130.1 response regulator transcription factor [Paenibacillus sp. SYP-B3998]
MVAKQPYRVLIADDHPLARKAIRSMLEPDSAFFIVGEAFNGEEAVLLCNELKPDVVLMDIHMTPVNGLEATRRIKQLHASTRIVMLTVSDDVADLFTALQFGAQGYLLKNMDPDEWLTYLHALLDDNSEVARLMADKLFHRFRAPIRADSIGPNPAMLTTREQEITTYVAMGNNNRQIAEILLISEHTVKNHMKNILEKLQFENRVQLTAFAIKFGLTRKGQN